MSDGGNGTVKASLELDASTKFCPSCGANGADLKVAVGLELQGQVREDSSCKKCGLDFSVTFKVGVSW